MEDAGPRVRIAYEERRSPVTEIATKQCPAARELSLGMSNLDCTIEDGFEDALRAEPNEVFGRHAGWNFNGKVWFDAERFNEDVWVYQEYQRTFTADSLESLMCDVSSEYGWE